MNQYFLALMFLNVQKSTFGWELETHTCEKTRESNVYQLDRFTPAIKIRFRNGQILFAIENVAPGHVERKQFCSVKVTSENGTYLGLHVEHSYGSSYFENRRITLTDASGFKRSFTSDNLPQTDIVTNKNVVNIIVTDNRFAGTVEVIVYQFRRDFCRAYERKCPFVDKCIDYRLFLKVLPEFCNPDEFTTTYKPTNYTDSTAGFQYPYSDSLIVFLLVSYGAMLLMVCVCTVCCCLKRRKKNTASNPQRRIQNGGNIPSVVYSVTEGETTTLQALTDVILVAPPDYDSLNFDYIEKPPTYEEIMAENQNP